MIFEMKKLLRFTGGGLRFLGLLILRSPVDLAMTVINAVFLQQAFVAITQNNAEKLNMSCLYFAIASLCIFLYNGTIWSIYAVFVVRMEKRLRVSIFDKISKFSFARIEKASHGEWLTRLNTDVQMPFSQPIHLPHAVNAVLRVSVCAIILWRLSGEIFVWVVLFAIPQILISQMLVARAMPSLQKKSLEATAHNTNELTAMITCADIAALYDGQEYLMKRFEKSSLALRCAKMRIAKRTAINGALAILGLGGYLVLLIAGSRWIASGSITFGDLTAAFQYRLGVIVGTTMFINCMVSIKASMAGIRRINELMSEEGEA